MVVFMTVEAWHWLSSLETVDKVNKLMYHMANNVGGFKVWLHLSHKEVLDYFMLNWYNLIDLS